MSDRKISAPTANVLEFRKLVASDENLQNEVSNAVGNGKWDPEALIKLGEANGLSFTAEDITSNLFEENDELSDFELEMVAAGGSTSCVKNDV
ncbi:Nif11-like leader peptide family RiPP precursor [Terasakiella pusilla]|uniref:Nif11-like leader peptide family RiPP precursor n=1 Tax=Terasakiella pusilla TaxID=64973 RepID=UPI003AA9DAC8